jgi:hypothetical protein
MGDVGSWLQGNWYDLGTLLILLAFLVGSAWFARNILRTLTTFQEQVAELLRLTVAGSSERSAKDAAAEEALAEGISSWLEPAASVERETEAIEVGRFESARGHLFAWLQGPMHGASETSFRRMMRWFQAPMGR